MVLGSSLYLGGSILILLAILQKIQGDQHRYQHLMHGTRQEQRQHHHLHGPHRDTKQPHQHTQPTTGHVKHQDSGQERFLFEKYEARRQYMRSRRMQQELTDMKARSSDIETQKMIERTKKRLDALKDEWEKEKAGMQASQYAPHERRLWKRSDPPRTEHFDTKGQEYDVPLTEVSLPEDTNVDLMEIMDHLEELREMFTIMDNAEIQEALVEASSIRNKNWSDEISEETLENLRKVFYLEDPQILERLALSEDETVPQVLAELLKTKVDKEAAKMNQQVDEGEDDRSTRVEEGTPKLEESLVEEEQEPVNANMEVKDGQVRTPIQEEKELRNAGVGNKGKLDEGLLAKETPRNLSKEDKNESVGTPVEKEETRSLSTENDSEGDTERSGEMFEDMAASGNGRDALELLKLMTAESNKGLVTENPVLALVQPTDMPVSTLAENRFNTNERIIQIVSLEEEDGKSGQLETESERKEMHPTLTGRGVHLDDSRRIVSGITEGNEDESHSSSEIRSYVEDENLLEELRQKTLDLIEKSRKRYSAEEASKAVEFMEMIFISPSGRINAVKILEDKTQAPASKREVSTAATGSGNEDLRRPREREHAEEKDPPRLQGGQSIPKPEGDVSEPAILEAATWEAARTAMSLPEEFHGLPEQAELLLSHVDLRMLQGEENEQEVVAEPEARLRCIGGRLCRSCARYSMLYSGYAVCCYKCGVYPVVTPRGVDHYACDCLY